MKKLIIWDFDGVISDTEKLWLETNRFLLNKYFNLNWDFETINRYLGGMSIKTKREILDKMGIVTDDKFWEEVLQIDAEKINRGLKPTEGIIDIFKDKTFDQCIATGGSSEKTVLKIKATGIEKYMPKNHVFSVDLVEKGKPEPDLFLFAAEKMGYMPKDCIVIEDSIAGMTAGMRAGMTVVAFLGCEMNNNPQYIKKVKDLGIKNIFFNMKDLHQFLRQSVK